MSWMAQSTFNEFVYKFHQKKLKTPSYRLGQDFYNVFNPTANELKLCEDANLYNETDYETAHNFILENFVNKEN